MCIFESSTCSLSAIFIYLFLLPALSTKSYGRARVWKAPSCPILYPLGLILAWLNDPEVLDSYILKRYSVQLGPSPAQAEPGKNETWLF